jgi:hypothetical protein
VDDGESAWIDKRSFDRQKDGIRSRRSNGKQKRQRFDFKFLLKFYHILGVQRVSRADVANFMLQKVEEPIEPSSDMYQAQIAIG